MGQINGLGLFQFTLKRMLQGLSTIAALVVMTFIVIRTAPGGPAYVLLGPDRYTPELEAEINRSLGLDRPVHVQLFRWVESLARGELGYSYFYRRSAYEVVTERLPATILLGGLAYAVSLVGGVSLGVFAAVKQASWVGRLLSGSVVTALSTPSFWLGIALIVIFAAWFQVLPSAGMAPIGQEGDLLQRARHLILPVLAIAIPHAASTALYTRAAMLEALASDYCRTARAKGAGESRVVWLHALRNALIPVATLAGLGIPHIVEGSIIIEGIFAWPGVGQLTVASVARRDFPVLIVITLAVGLSVLIGNFLADVLYRRLDPRIHFS